MERGRERAYAGQHYQLGRTLNVPQPLSQPRPRIMIGGSGEKKTLRLVAEYADACNLFNSPDLAHKLDVLRKHCSDVGRDYDTIEKTAITAFDLGPNGEGAPQLLEQLRALHELGITAATGSLMGPEGPATVAAFGEHIIPEISTW